jgi:hypothetical protein
MFAAALLTIAPENHHNDSRIWSSVFSRSVIFVMLKRKSKSEQVDLARDAQIS